MNIAQRQAYYVRLLNLGYPDIVAASMASQATEELNHLFRAPKIYTFCWWGDTAEGIEFWEEIAHEIRERGMQ